MTTDYRAGTATISDDGYYRYDLTRRWGAGPPTAHDTVLWVMLNPSYADADHDDATIRLCRGFSLRWGYDAMAIVNQFAYRATYPHALANVPDPVGPDNPRTIRQWIRSPYVGVVVAAWGAGWLHTGHARFNIEGWADDEGLSVMCLGHTKGGHPRHPRGMPRDTVFTPFSGSERAPKRGQRGTD